MARTTPSDLTPEDFGLTEVSTAELDGVTFNQVTIKQPVDMSFMLRGLPGDSCQCPHWGTITKGSMVVRYADGREEKVNAGDVFHMTPGHVPTYEVGTEIVQFSPTDDLQATDAAIRRNLEALQGS